MPRLPKKVPLSIQKEGRVSASLVFACVECGSCNNWAFIAYNQNGHIFQVRKCQYWSCLSSSTKGTWMTQSEQFERTRYQHEP